MHKEHVKLVAGLVRRLALNLFSAHFERPYIAVMSILYPVCIESLTELEVAQFPEPGAHVPNANNSTMDKKADHNTWKYVPYYLLFFLC